MGLEQPIGIFDSGIGGLTVMKTLLTAFPREKFIYFADTAHVPFGDKSSEEILEHTLHAIEFLTQKNIKLLVIACHTASVETLADIQKKVSFPVIGAINGTLNSFALDSCKTIGLLGTHRTIASGLYPTLMKNKYPHLDIHSIACPLFVPLIEQDCPNLLQIEQAVQTTLKQFKTLQPDPIFLVCTHYPLLIPMLQTVFPSNIQIVNPAIGIQKELASLLQEKQLENVSSVDVSHLFYCTGNVESFEKLVYFWFAWPIHARKVY